MAISIDKILTISADEYVASKEGHLSSYDFVGVHYSLVTIEPSQIMEAVGEFALKVPDSAEAVVGYQNNTSANGDVNGRAFYIQMSGTALIPEKK